MKKRKILTLTAVAAGITAYLVAPERPAPEKTAPFYGRNFAHRGLYTKDGVIPETSLPAFRAAAEAGYGVELDVRLSKDNRVIVFHDENLKRLCGVDKYVESLTYDELSELRILDTECKIPLLNEVLAELDGAPVIVEVKRGHNNKLLCAMTMGIMRKYKGPFCVESFDPFIVTWFRNHAPDVLRGQLSKQQKDLKELDTFMGFVLSRLLTNVSARPNFVAYQVGRKPLTVKLCEKLGAMKVTWTAHDRSNEKDSDAVIFEHFRPGVSFK